MKILVTGGAGFIGSHLVKRLLDENHEVVIIDDFNNYYCPSLKRFNASKLFSYENCEIIETDIRNDYGLEEVFAENEFDYIYHLAARPGVRPSLKDPLLYEDINIKGTMILLDMFKKNPCKNFIFASTSSVYGDTDLIPFKEDNPLGNTLSPYAATKASAEQMVRLYSELYNLNTTVFRFFTVYGESGRPDMAVALFTKAIMEGLTLNVFGDGSQKRDFTFVSDIIDAVVGPLSVDLEGHNVFNVGGSKTHSLSRLIEIIEEVVGKKAVINYGDFVQGDMKETFADTTKAKEVFGFESKVTLEDGVKRYYEWLKNNYDVVGDCIVC